MAKAHPALPRLHPITPIKPDPTYGKVWREVDGALRKAILAHPECFRFGPGLTHCRESVLKRVTGDVMSLLLREAEAAYAKAQRNGENGGGE